jgi:hypothetical protein
MTGSLRAVLEILVVTKNSQQDRRRLTLSVRARKETEVEQTRSDPLSRKGIFSSLDKRKFIMTPSTLNDRSIPSMVFQASNMGFDLPISSLNHSRWRACDGERHVAARAQNLRLQIFLHTSY